MMKKETSQLISKIIICGVLFIFIFFLGVGCIRQSFDLDDIWIDPSANSSINTEVTEGALDDPTQWKMFTSEILGFRFEYPAEWGVGEEKIIDVVASGEGESGKTYSLFFSKNDIKIFGQSDDFVIGGAGGNISFYHFYSGDDESKAKVNSYVTLDIGSIAQCYQMDYAPPSYQGVIELSLPGREINGVRFIMPLFSEAVRATYSARIQEFIEKEKPCIPGSGVVSDDVLSKEEEIKNLLLQGVDFDAESTMNLKIFKRIAESAVFFDPPKDQGKKDNEWLTFTSTLGFGFEYPAVWEGIRLQYQYTTNATIKWFGEFGNISSGIQTNQIFFGKRVYEIYGLEKEKDFSRGNERVEESLNKINSSSSSVITGITLDIASVAGCGVNQPPRHFLGLLMFQLNGKIDGAILVVPLLSTADEIKYSVLIQDFIYKEKPCLPNGLASDKVAVKEKELEEILWQGENLDEESKENLEIFKKISKSAKVLQ